MHSVMATHLGQRVGYMMKLHPRKTWISISETQISFLREQSMEASVLRKISEMVMQLVFPSPMIAFTNTNTIWWQEVGGGLVPPSHSFTTILVMELFLEWKRS